MQQQSPGLGVDRIPHTESIRTSTWHTAEPPTRLLFWCCKAKVCLSQRLRSLWRSIYGCWIAENFQYWLDLQLSARESIDRAQSSLHYELNLLTLFKNPLIDVSFMWKTSPLEGFTSLLLNLFSISVKSYNGSGWIQMLPLEENKPSITLCVLPLQHLTTVYSCCWGAPAANRAFYYPELTLK